MLLLHGGLCPVLWQQGWESPMRKRPVDVWVGWLMGLKEPTTARACSSHSLNNAAKDNGSGLDGPVAIFEEGPASLHAKRRWLAHLGGLGWDRFSEVKRLACKGTWKMCGVHYHTTRGLDLSKLGLSTASQGLCTLSSLLTVVLAKGPAMPGLAQKNHE